MQKTEKEEIDYLNIEQKNLFSVDDDIQSIDRWWSIYIHLLISMNGTTNGKEREIKKNQSLVNWMENWQKKGLIINRYVLNTFYGN